MKLTGELKDKVDKAETMEAKKAIIAEAGMELTEDEVESVAGGILPGGQLAICTRPGCIFRAVFNYPSLPPKSCPRCGGRINVIRC